MKNIQSAFKNILCFGGEFLFQRAAVKKKLQERLFELYDNYMRRIVQR